MSANTMLNWYFDEEARLHEQMTLARLEPKHVRWIRRGQQQLMRILIVLAVIVIVVSLGREYLVWEETRMRSVIAQSVAVEALAWYQLDYAAVTASLDPDAREDWVRWHTNYQQGRRNWAGRDARAPQVEVGNVDFLGQGRALVEVRLQASEVPDVESYREYRIYRNLAGEWLRTSTDESLWGTQAEQTVGRFHFIYRTQDLAAVEAVAPEVESIWQNVYARLGLPPSQNSSTLEIVIRGENVGVGPVRFEGDRLLLLSPKLVRAPLYEDEAQTLSRMISMALTQRVMDEFMQGQGFDPQWAVTYEAAVDWLAEEANPLLPRDPKLESGALRKVASQTGLPRLDDLLEKRTSSYFWWTGWASTAARSLVAYGLNTYGAEKAPALIDGLTTADDWEELTQEVFGISAGEFEKGWHGYLRRRYGLE